MSAVNFIGQNAASGRNIDQVQNADINVDGGYSGNHGFKGNDDCYYPRGDDCYYPGGDDCYIGGKYADGDAQANVIQVNQAAGKNINQFQNAYVNVNGGHSANYGFSRGDDCYHPCDPCYVPNPCVDGNAQANVVQVNQAAGRNINQFQNADVNVDGGLSTNYGFSRGDDCFYPGGGDHYYGQYGDAQANVVQVNQAAGKNIDQFQNADVNVDAFGGHNTFYDSNNIDSVVHGFGADCHPVFDGCADAVFLPTFC